MVGRGKCEVERVDHELKFVTPTGRLKRPYLFEWVGFPLSAATWQEGAFGKSARLIAQDIEPLRALLKTSDEAKLEEHHQASLDSARTLLPRDRIRQLGRHRHGE